MSDRCFICAEDNAHVLEEHHIIPRRHGGSNDPENLVTLCSNCHSAIEKLYDDSVFRKLGAAPVRSASEARVSYKETREAVDQFLAECRRISADDAGWATKQAVRDLYSQWAERNGVEVAPTPRQFGAAVAELRDDVDTAQRRIKGDRVRVYTGLVVDGVAADGV